MRGRILGAVALLVTVGTFCRADDKPLDRAKVDERVVKAVYETALLGTDIFNKGKHEECFRLYQGVLIGLQPMLDHRPDLMKSVRAKMEKARSMKGSEGAFVLRDALDEIQNEIAPGAKTGTKPDPKAEGKKTLWDRMGGEKVVKAVVHDLFLLAIEDKKVNLLRDGKYKLDAKGVENFEQRLVEIISAATGGPLAYKGMRNMQMVHEGMKITDAEFDALAADLVKALEKHKVGKTEIDELMKEFDKTRVVIVEVKGKGM
jgi:hemoglobin